MEAIAGIHMRDDDDPDGFGGTMRSKVRGGHCLLVVDHPPEGSGMTLGFV